jgi:hypothetical protein
LINNGSIIDAVNDEMKTPLFMAVHSNNHSGVATLLRNNADYKIRSYDGQNPFDLIKDASEWVNSGCFDNEEIMFLKSSLTLL